MSPEQAQGTKTVDWRSDLWSLGVIAFECMTGRRPFESEALGDLLMKILVGQLPVPSQFADVPAGFDAWWARAASRDPAQRFQSAKELADGLTLALGITKRDRSSRNLPASEAFENTLQAGPPSSVLRGVAPTLASPAPQPPISPPVLARSGGMARTLDGHLDDAPRRRSLVLPISIAIGATLIGATIVAVIALRASGQADATTPAVATSAVMIASAPPPPLAPLIDPAPPASTAAPSATLAAGVPHTPKPTPKTTTPATTKATPTQNPPASNPTSQPGSRVGF
jgi:serine/threonine-protein kinase